jgi:endo-1,4-beta-D-glucanase Y
LSRKYPAELIKYFFGSWERILFSPDKHDILAGMGGKDKTPWGNSLRLVVLGVLLLAVGVLSSCRDITANRLPWVLQASWASYREHFISPEGRVVLAEREGGTISEAQAYALLRALWAGDEKTFVQVYRWTSENLSREGSHGDHLLSWHWGKKPDGSWGV